MIKTEFMQLLEELDSINEAPLKNYRIVYYEDEVKKSFTVQAASKEEAEQIGWSRVDADSLYVSEEINEATDKAASKAFWAAAKKGQIDDASFHAAYDDELRELGLLDLFNSDGGFTGRSVYGRIKEAKDANPDSWALKALSKLWALRYTEGVYFPGEAARIKAADDEAARRREADRIERERVAQETKINTIQEYTRDYKMLLPEVLKDGNQKFQDALKRYMTAYNVSESDFDIVIESNQWGTGVKVLPNKSGHAYRFDAPVQNKYKALLSLVYSEVKEGADQADAAEAKANKATNEVIDVFKYDENASAILLGESGQLYYLSANSTSKNDGKYVYVNYVKDVPESYKVIYTKVSATDSRNSNSTYQDKISYSYESWDSSEANKISEFIPKIGRGDGTWSEWITTKITAGNGKNYSLMDNIDSWAYTEYTSLATD